jgi:hypothetical protein
MVEQIALRFPDGTKDRIKTLAAEGETQTAVILRALASLEGRGSDPEHQAITGPPGRLDALEARVEALEAAAAPVADEGAEYPLAVRYMAIGMQAQGYPPAEIRAALTKACGRAPSAKHLARTLRRWEGKNGASGIHSIAKQVKRC